MDEISTKAAIIGVSIFVTVMIITVLILEFTQIKAIYKVNAETNISFEERLDEFDKYRDSTNEFSGLDVINTIEKYKYDNSVEVYVEDESAGTMMFVEDGTYLPSYDWKYKARLDDKNTIFKIIFQN